MDCTRYSDALSDAAAGARVSAALEAHMATCAGCRGELAALQQLLTLAGQDLKQLSVMEPSAGFAQRIRTSVIHSAPAQVRLTSWLWPSFAMATALGIALVLYLSGPPPRPAAELVQAPEHSPPPAAVVQTPVDPGSVGADVLQKTAPPRSRSARATSVGPRILVPPGQSEALTAFLAPMGQVEPVADASGAVGEPLVPLAALAPITINPIEIVPLDPPPHFGT